MREYFSLVMFPIVAGLAISTAAFAQTVVVDLEVDPGTVPVPPGGGTVIANVTIENLTDSSLTMDFWVEGLEQGWILRDRGPRRRELKPLGTYTSALEIVLSDHDYGEYSVTGYVGSYPGDIVDRDSVVFATQISEAGLTAGDGAAYDGFGSSVSVSGQRALIGVPWDDDTAADAGSAYVFHYNGSDWVEEAKFTPTDGAVSDNFGRSVSVSGNYALIGVPYDDDNGDDAGSAYVYHHDGSNWVEEARLTTSDGVAVAKFGFSVSLSDDYALIGAPSDDDMADEAGSAYIFHYDGTTWVEEAKLTASDGAASDNFGWSVSLSGMYALIGAPWDDDNGANSGSAYVFRYDGSNWVEEARLFAVDGWSPYEFFGYAISLSGDRALVGAMGDDEQFGEAGSAYIFHYDGSRWVNEAKLFGSDTWYLHKFGISVSLSGDLAFIGASNGSISHAAYIYRRDGSRWVEDAKLTASRGGEFDYFGASVSLSDDYALVGAYHNDDQGTDAGSAYMYSGFVRSIPALAPHDFDKSAVQEAGRQSEDREVSIVQNYPNPFNPTTTFEFSIRSSVSAHLSVYNILGQTVATVVDEKLSPGTYKRQWDATGQPSGVYFYRLSAENYVETKKLLLLR